MRSGVRSLQRRSIRQLQVHEHVTLVLVRKEARGQLKAEQARQDSAPNQHDECDGALADERAGNSYVAVRRPREDAVEAVEKPAQQTSAVLAWPQQQRR